MAKKNDFIKEVDTFIGNKIYRLRLATGMSRQELALAIGVTHQQLLKYEKGQNRISAGRLVLIAKALGKNISFFYEGLEEDAGEEGTLEHHRLCLELSRNFIKINKPKQMEAINALVKTLAINSSLQQRRGKIT